MSEFLDDISDALLKKKTITFKDIGMIKRQPNMAGDV